jgi:uncharacterized protein (DUF305 family)
VVELTSAGADTGPEAVDIPGTVPRRRPWRTIVGVALVALLATALGFGGGVLVAHPRHPADGSAEAGFARDMITHHGQAVAMATIEYRGTSDAGLKTMAVDIALTQQAQIGMMSAWLDTWGLPPTSTRPAMAWVPDGAALRTADGLMPGMATPAQMRQLQSASGRDRDVLFCRMMITHHLGGIHMADAILGLSHDGQVTALAQTIKDSQQYDITVLQDALKRLGATP